jgi:heptosyltransferase-2
VDRVIIFAPNWLGDAVMALPAVSAVRTGLPAAALGIAARPSVASLFRMVEGIDEVVEPGGTTTAPFDVAILLPNSFRSALLAKREGIRERWGYRADWRGSLLTRAIPPPPALMHQIERYRQLVRALGFPDAPSAPRLDVAPSYRTAAECLLRSTGWDGRTPLVALAPGAAYGSSKRWPAERFAAVARTLASDGLQPVLIGSSADTMTGRAVESALGGPRSVLNVIGQTDLPVLSGVLAHARALVSNDSGAMHVGAAVGVPVAAILGPSDERITAPRSQSSSAETEHTPAEDRRVPVVLVKKKVWCSPCGFRECPIGHRCMRGISVEEVSDAVRQLL